ncbi:MAG: 30S ribosomal protein S8 [Desulfomicrobium sp.]|jgi:small subunit ribosomal protein S8|nr:30S ribosomal protein S8 [Desulfomicrobium sp.]NLV97899.1 30S ribosomal protein S8 [Desulfovibrionales bacterium]
MAVVDPIADLLTRIRNAYTAMHSSVKVSSSRMRSAILDIMQEEGYITGFISDDGSIVVDLKYYDGKGVVSGLQRVSKPGRRVYVASKDIPLVQNGLGICILSTSKGILEGRKAAEIGVGGELLCEIW